MLILSFVFAGCSLNTMGAGNSFFVEIDKLARERSEIEALFDFLDDDEGRDILLGFRTYRRFIDKMPMLSQLMLGKMMSMDCYVNYVV